jgi:glycosyltransferase involved in cell wall biosynthesis
LEQRVAQARALQDQIVRAGPAVAVPAPFLVALGNSLEGWSSFNGASLSGTPSIALPVVEDAAEVEKNIDRLEPYPLVIAASRWNAELLGSLGTPALLCHQGYDPVLFNPSICQRRSRNDGRFRVFSGGKAEYRKAQDLVLKAFSAFAATHDDAVLIAAWASPWPLSGRSFDGKNSIGGPPATADGSPDFAAWAQRYGIKPQQFEAVPAMPNHAIPDVLAEIDVAVFPNRVEGGTNIVAMECLACGLPTILARGHGHDDLLEVGCGIPFDPPAPNPFWHGSEVEPIVAALTDVYDGRVPAPRPLGEDWGWPARIQELVGIMRAV